ncbi:mitochondrial import inner membrane translocase subunit TIM44-2 [Tanacetum coccineum]
MAARKLIRDLILANRPLYRRIFAYNPASTSALRVNRLIGAPNGRLMNREYSVFNEFTNKIKGEANRTKQTTEQLYKHVDGAWTEAEATAKKVSENLREKVFAAKEEVKGTFGIGKEESSESSSSSANDASAGKADNENKQSAGGEAKTKESGYAESAETIFSKVRSGVSSSFQKARDAKVLDMAKKGYNIVRDELNGSPSKRKRAQAASAAASQANVERSTRTDLTIVPVKQSRFSKKWEAFKEKCNVQPMFKRVSGLSEPVVTKSQEIAEDMRERWETSDHPVVHKIQDVFKETDAAMSFKEVRRRDPYDTAAHPSLYFLKYLIANNIFLICIFKGETEELEKYCSPKIVERCKAQHKICDMQGTFYDNKILHISKVEFQTQQVYCVRDRLGEITEGGKVQRELKLTKQSTGY